MAFEKPHTITRTETRHVQIVACTASTARIPSKKLTTAAKTAAPRGTGAPQTSIWERHALAVVEMASAHGETFRSLAQESEAGAFWGVLQPKSPIRRHENNRLSHNIYGQAGITMHCTLCATPAKARFTVLLQEEDEE